MTKHGNSFYLRYDVMIGWCMPKRLWVAHNRCSIIYRGTRIVLASPTNDCFHFTMVKCDLKYATTPTPIRNVLSNYRQANSLNASYSMSYRPALNVSVTTAYSPIATREKLALCRLALQMPQPQPAIIESVQAFMLRVSQIDVLCCPHCGHGTMQVIDIFVAVKHRPVLTTGPPP